MQPDTEGTELAPAELDARIAAARRGSADTRWHAPYRNLGALLAARASLQPGDPFLAYCDEERGIERRYSFAEIALAAGRAAALFRSLGVERDLGEAVASLDAAL